MFQIVSLELAKNAKGFALQVNHHLQASTNLPELLIQRAKCYLNLNRPHFALGDICTCLNMLSKMDASPLLSARVCTIIVLFCF